MTSKKNKSLKIKLAATIACSILGSYWLGGYLMYMLCMCISAGMQTSPAVWLIPCFAMFILSFCIVLFMQNRKNYEYFIE